MTSEPTSSDMPNETTAHYAPFLQPTDTDKIPFTWDGNRATISAMLSQVDKFFKRTGLFSALLQHHAAPLSSGKLAIDSALLPAGRQA